MSDVCTRCGRGGAVPLPITNQHGETVHQLPLTCEACARIFVARTQPAYLEYLGSPLDDEDRARARLMAQLLAIYEELP